MKKILLSFLISIATSATSFAQWGNNALNMGVELGFPSGDFADFKKGISFAGKALIGIGEKGQISFASGYSNYNIKPSTSDNNEKTSIVPLLAGYRHYFDGLYLEPQIGYGRYTLRSKSQNGNVTTKIIDRQSSMTWAMGGGVNVGHLDMGLRYQQGYPSGDGVGLFVMHVAYQLKW